MPDSQYIITDDGQITAWYNGKRYHYNVMDPFYYDVKLIIKENRLDLLESMESDFSYRGLVILRNDQIRYYIEGHNGYVSDHTDIIPNNMLREMIYRKFRPDILKPMVLFLEKNIEDHGFNFEKCKSSLSSLWDAISTNKVRLHPDGTLI